MNPERVLKIDRTFERCLKERLSWLFRQNIAPYCTPHFESFFRTLLTFSCHDCPVCMIFLKNKTKAIATRRVLWREVTRSFFDRRVLLVAVRSLPGGFSVRWIVRISLVFFTESRVTSLRLRWLVDFDGIVGALKLSILTALSQEVGTCLKSFEVHVC